MRRSYGTNSKSTFDKILSDIKRAKGNTGDGLSSSGRRGTTVGDVYLPFGESRGNGTGDYGDGTENLQSTLTEYNDEASDDSGASFVTFSNDCATIRNYVKDGEVSEKAKYSMTKASAESFADKTYAEITEEQQKLYQRERELAERKRTANND